MRVAPSMIAMLAIAAIANPALAAPHTVMVFKSEGNGDPKVRAKLDAAVVALAKKDPAATVQPGDISFSDAAAAAGCKPEAPTCANDVMTTFAVDEIVVVTTAKKPGATDVVVKRAAKGAAPRESAFTITGDAVAVDAAAPLFGGRVEHPVGPQPIGPQPIGPQPPGPGTRTGTGTSGVGTGTASGGVTVTEGVAARPTTVAQPSTDPMQPAGEQQVDNAAPRRGLYVAGMIGGGALVLIGVGMWAAASDVQSDIDSNPARSRADFEKIADLETRGDRLASTGNVLFLAGAVLGGISTYMFIKKGRHRDPSVAQAMIMPTLIDHGGGIAFTWGVP